jgi:hypothetical protein
MIHARTRSLAAVAVAVSAGLTVYLLVPSEEARVRARLGHLAESLCVPLREQDLARFARASRVRGYLAEDVTVEFEAGSEPPVRGREALVGLVARPWAPQAGVRVELARMTVTLDEARTSADVRLEARGVSLDPSADPPTLEVRLLSLTLRRVDGTWLVSAVRVMSPDDAAR